MSGSERRRLVESPSCPLLGLPDDPSTRFSYPSVAHRCRSTDRPRPIDLGHQAAFCLAAAYPDCPRYQAAAAPRRSGGDRTTPPPIATRPGDSPGVKHANVEIGAVGPSGAPGNVDASRTLTGAARMPWSLDRAEEAGTTVSVEPSAPPHRPDGAAPSVKIGWPRVVILVVAIAILAGAAYLASPAIGDWLRQVGGGAAAASSSPILRPSPTSAPTPPTPSPGPTSTHSPNPTATAAAAPTIVATPFTHVVAKGETLIGIAARYGVTVVAIRDANGLKDPGLIYVGQQLVIPPK
jgi:LysM domain